MRKSIELLERLVDGSIEHLEDRFYEVCHSPNDFDWLKRFMRECVELLDFAEALAILKGTDFKEQKNYVIGKIEEILNTDHYSKYNDFFWKAVSERMNISMPDRIKANMELLEVFKGKVDEGKHEEWWEKIFNKDSNSDDK